MRFSKEELADQIRREKLVSYAKVLPRLVAGSWLPGIGVVFLAWGKAENPVAMLVWLGLFSAHALYRFIHHFWLKKNPPQKAADFDRLLRNFVASGCINGSFWGSALFVFGDVPLDVRLLVYCLIFSFCGLGAMVAGYCAAAYGAYAVCALTPLIVQLVAMGGAYNLTVAAMILIAVGVIYYIASHNYAATTTLIALKIENQLIADELEISNNQLKQANEGKSRLISAASHDLRQPVYGLTLMFNKMIEHCRLYNCDLPEPCPVIRKGREIQNIELGFQFLSQSLNNLLDLSRLEAGKVSVELRPLDLGELFSRLAHEFVPQAQAKGVALKIRATKYWVKADGNLLHSVLSNLVANAVSYTEKGGVLVAARRIRSSCRIYVLDQGVGIDVDDVNSRRVFDEYYRASKERKGTSSVGLGLAIAERFSEAMKSTIGLRSEKGKGSCFHIDFPLAQPVVAEHPIAIMLPGGAAMQGFAGLQSMVVTENQASSEWMLRLLEENDAVVSCCASLVEAYMWAKRVPSGLLVIDMPQRLGNDPSHDWVLIGQIAGFSSALQLVVLADERRVTTGGEHPFGIPNCRLVDRGALTPLKLKSILMRELRQRGGART